MKNRLNLFPDRVDIFRGGTLDIFRFQGRIIYAADGEYAAHPISDVMSTAPRLCVDRLCSQRPSLTPLIERDFDAYRDAQCFG